MSLPFCTGSSNPGSRLELLWSIRWTSRVSGGKILQAVNSFDGILCKSTADELINKTSDKKQLNCQAVNNPEQFQPVLEKGKT